MATGIDVKKCFSAAQERQLKGEIRDYIRDEVMAEASEYSTKIAKEWLKENKTYLKGIIGEELERQVKARAKRIYIDVSYSSG